MKVYLLFYNLLCLALWSQILFTLVHHIFSASSFQNLQPGVLWAKISTTLLFVQSLAILEILHPILGLTRTPVFTAILQVGSRLVVLWGYTSPNSTAYNHTSFLLMCFSWSAVEIIRYAFYSFKCAEQEVPSFIFHARYSAFVLLYPTGITGEIGQIYMSLSNISPVMARLSHILIFLYVPGSPFMINNMFRMRRRALNGRKKKKKPEPEGLVWPVTNKITNTRSTSVTNKNIWLQAVKDIDNDVYNYTKNIKNWRFGYVKAVLKNVKLCLKSKESALKISANGLQAARNEFLFVRDGKEYSCSDAMNNFKGTYLTGIVKGSSKQKIKNYEIPYKGKNLVLDEAKAALESWVASGTIESSTGESIKTVLENPDWFDLSDKYFVLLGASSAMGPCADLLKLGANIIAIDLDRPFIWEKLIKQTRESRGTLIFPLKKPQKEISGDEQLFASAGSNLLTNTPEIANWLCTVVEEEDITIGNYTYLDGALHVQLALACDLIIEKVSDLRTKNTNLAFLCTPTDAHCIPEEAAKESLKNYNDAPFWQKSIEAVGVKDVLVKNALPPIKSEDDGPIYMVDGIVSAQGPNYCLAKRIQHWRCVLAHNEGQVVSSNIAPSTATKSVVSNASFAAAYGGLHLFKSMEVFYQETSSAVMLALLINDIMNEKGISRIANFRASGYLNPFRLFEVNGFHGGVWRSPYKMGTVGIPSALFYYLQLPSVKLGVVTAVVTIYGTTNYVLHGHPV